jgi:hypothetical protein
VYEYEVASQREVGAGTDGHAVDGRHRGLVELPQLPNERLNTDAQRFGGRARVEAFAARLGHGRRRQVHAGAERVTAAGDEQRPHVRVGAGSADGVDELIAHLDRERVLRLGSLERDAAHMIGAGLDAQHRRPTGWS